MELLYRWAQWIRVFTFILSIILTYVIYSYINLATGHGFIAKFMNYKDSENTTNNGECSLVVPQLSEKPLPITGLISFPGAGNTWTRHLIQQISGIGTSSFGCDKRLRDSAFPFECMHASNRVIVVKSHAFRLNIIHSFERAILLIRNPYANLVAYFNYRYGGGHAGYANDNSYKKWPHFVKEKIAKWLALNSAVLQKFTGPLYVLLYENLQTELKHELRKLSKFLDIEVNATVLDCAVSQQEGSFHRVRKPIQMKELFTDEMIRSITIASNNVSDILEARFGMHLNHFIPKYTTRQPPS